MRRVECRRKRGIVEVEIGREADTGDVRERAIRVNACGFGAVGINV